MKKFSCKNCLKKTLTALLLSCAVLVIASCDKTKDDPKSAECDIVLFNVSGQTWNIDNTGITFTYPPATPEEPLAPIITLSEGATVNPPSGTAQNFFTAQGVTYTVTAEDGVTKKVYTAKATRTRFSNCAITSFKVDGADWEINDSLITYVFPTETPITPLTPVITLSEGATVNPPAGTEQNFFTEQGVRYTVTSEDGTNTKTYIVRARRSFAGVEIQSFRVNGSAWTINDSLITYYYPVGTQEEPLTPVITLAAGATIDPPSGTAQNFFTEQGVRYTVTSEGGTVTRTYIATAKIMRSEASILEFSMDGVKWDIVNDSLITHEYTEEERQALQGIAPSISLPGGATISPPISTNLDFFSARGVTFTVTSEDEKTTKTYIAKATVLISGGDGAVKWNLNESGVLNISGEGPMGDYNHDDNIMPPWYQHRERIKTVIIHDGVTTVGSDAFRDCDGITSITIGNSVTTIGYYAFYACKGLTYIAIPNSVTYIGPVAFIYCENLARVDMGTSITNIGQGAFMQCQSLTSINIPATVTTIGDYAFIYCSALKTVVNFNPEPQSINPTVFQGVNIGNILLSVPSSAMDAYKAAPVWASFNIIGI